MGVATLIGQSVQTARNYEVHSKKLSTGLDTTNPANNATVEGLQRTVRKSTAYAQNIVSATAFLQTAQSAAALITDKFNAMLGLSLSASSGSGSDLTKMQSQFKTYQDEVAQLVMKTSYNANKIFDSITSAETFKVGDGLSVKADLDPSGPSAAATGAIAGISLQDSSAIRKSAAATAVATTGALTDTIVIYGEATFSAGVAAGVAAVGNITLSPGAVMVVNIAGAEVFFTSDSGVIALAAQTLTFTDTGLAIAAGGKYNFTGGEYFTPTVVAATLTPTTALTAGTGGAVGDINSEGAITAYGSSIDTIAKAKVAFDFVNAALEAMSVINTKITVSLGSLETHATNTNNTISNFNTAASQLQSADILSETALSAEAQNNLSATAGLIQASLSRDADLVDMMKRVLS
ncbi:MAG: hypothetical protein V4485_05015 [Pseudomonadota bacterium]